MVKRRLGTNYTWDTWEINKDPGQNQIENKTLSLLGNDSEFGGEGINLILSWVLTWFERGNITRNYRDTILWTLDEDD